MAEKEKTNPLIFAAVVALALFAGNEAYKLYDRSAGEFADSASLQDLVSVSSDLKYGDGRMAHVHGLSNLTRVSGTLDLSNNALLNIDGLNSLAMVDSGFDLSGNRFYTLSPLSELFKVGGSMDLRENPNLFNIDALGNISELGGSLYLDPDIHRRPDFRPLWQIQPAGGGGDGVVGHRHHALYFPAIAIHYPVLRCLYRGQDPAQSGHYRLLGRHRAGGLCDPVRHPQPGRQ